jgi:hypothetical protein
MFLDDGAFEGLIEGALLDSFVLGFVDVGLVHVFIVLINSIYRK